MLGTHEHEVFLQLKGLLVPLGIQHFYTDGADVYDRHLESAQHAVGKIHPQKMERQHLTCRTRRKRLMRKTSCFSKSILLQDIVIGLFVNRDEFGLLV